MSDYIIRGTIGDGSIRVFMAVTTETVNQAFQIHDTSPVVSAALGRLLTAGAMMGSMLKNESDIITLSIRGDGPIGGIVVTADSLSRVKGYVFSNRVEVSPKENGKLDVAGAIGAGTLYVIKDIGLKEPYTGQISLVSGEIAEDLTFYFAKSEQTPSAVALGVLVETDWRIRQAGGFIIQALPQADDSVLDQLEQTLQQMPSITNLLESGQTPEDILRLLAGGLSYEILDIRPVQYTCNCSRHKVAKALISLGREELRAILEEDNGATLHCHFCNQDYHFEGDEIAKMLQ